jgi:hypothetical protein
MSVVCPTELNGVTLVSCLSVLLLLKDEANAFRRMIAQSKTMVVI